MQTNEIKLIDGHLMSSSTKLVDKHDIPFSSDLSVALATIKKDGSIQPDIVGALFLQHLHFFLHMNKINLEMGNAKVNTYRDNRVWCFQTLNQWEDNFCWISLSTIKRTIKSLKEKGVLLQGNFNAADYDRTSWYSIDYSKLAELVESGQEILKEKKKKIEQAREKQKEHNQKQNAESKSKRIEQERETIKALEGQMELEIERLKDKQKELEKIKIAIADTTLMSSFNQGQIDISNPCVSSLVHNEPMPLAHNEPMASGQDEPMQYNTLTNKTLPLQDITKEIISQSINQSKEGKMDGLIEPQKSGRNYHSSSKQLSDAELEQIDQWKEAIDYRLCEIANDDSFYKYGDMFVSTKRIITDMFVADHVRVNGVNYPRAVVQSVLMKMNGNAIDSAIEKFIEKSKKGSITHADAFMKSVIYNNAIETGLQDRANLYNQAAKSVEKSQEPCTSIKNSYYDLEDYI